MFYREGVFVVLPQLVPFHPVALVEFDGASVGRHIKAQIVCHDLLLFSVGKHLSGGRQSGKGHRIYIHELIADGFKYNQRSISNLDYRLHSF